MSPTNVSNTILYSHFEYILPFVDFDVPTSLADRSPWLRDVLEIVAGTTDPTLSNDLWVWPHDIPAVLEQALGLEPWLPFLAAQFGVADPIELTCNERGETTIEPTGEEEIRETATSSPEMQQTAVIGIGPGEPASSQTALPIK